MPRRGLWLLVPLVVRSIVHASPILIHTVQEEPPDVSVGTSEFWWRLAVIAALVLAGGCFAGLTLGLMGLDMVNLEVLSTAGTDTEQKQAKRVLMLLRRGRHWVLVVLLLSNVVVNESLPIFLDSVLGGGAWAVFISTALIFVFGEIIPQSLCARYGLAIGAASAPIVLCLMIIEAPVAWPLAKLLDLVLGQDEGTTYRKIELQKFVSLHRYIGTDHLNEDEVTIINAVLELNDKTVEHIMTPFEDLYTLSSTSILDDATVSQILGQGYSRIPIHTATDPRNYVGMLLTKNLITYDPEDSVPVSEMPISPLPEADRGMTCLEALNYFQQGRSHMLLVSENPGSDYGALGVVSLEDVIEEMIGEEIIDETDMYVDVHNRVRVVRKPAFGRAARTTTPIHRDAANKQKMVRSTSLDVNMGRPQGLDMDSPSPTSSSAAAQRFQKVRVKGHDTPPLRADIVRKYADQANHAQRSPIREPYRSTEPQGMDGHHKGEDVSENDHATTRPSETQPLLGNKRK